MLHETGIFTPGTGAYRGRPDPICTPPKFNSKSWKLMMKIKTSYVCFWGKLGPIFRGKLAVFRGVVATYIQHIPTISPHGENARTHEVPGERVGNFKARCKAGGPMTARFFGTGMKFTYMHCHEWLRFPWDQCSR